MKKHYLNILGLKENASEEEIKKAFRKKALQFHPDRNDSPYAEKLFVKVCDAYEKLLSGDIVEKNSDTTSQSPEYYRKRYNKSVTPEELEKRIQKAREHALYKKYKEDNILDIAYKDLQKSFIRKFSNVIAIISLTIAIIILMDFKILNPEVEKAVLMFQAQNGLTLKSTFYDVSNNDSLATKKFDFFTSIEDKHFKRLMGNTLVKVYKTPLLNQRVAYSDLHTSYDQSMFSNRNLYMGYWFFQIIFFLPLLNFFARGPNSVYLVFVHLNSSLPIFAFILFTLGLLFL